jgi:16S rRNA (guanine966-N2)-methyltransferase
MRVIAGMYRSRTIDAPRGMETRPTSDRLRERLFNILAPYIPGAHVADLFAGSGAIGIEAISRGAEFVLFAEKAPTAVDAIRTADAPFHVVFLDPPYEQAADYGETLRLLAQDADRLLAPDAIVVVEHRAARRGKANDIVTDTYGRLGRYRTVEQGEAALSFYRIASDEPQADLS